MVFDRISPGNKEVLRGWGGIEVTTEDNVRGRIQITVQMRPVLLGRVEISAKIETRPVHSERVHTKRAIAFATPAAMRELAAKLIESAEEAEKTAVRPRPVK
jgi:hypothetical protein